jgi:hypothetical protein
MKPFRVRQARSLIASAGLALIGTLAAAHQLQAAAAEPLLRPTPLVLKDGRIANVSIHVVPFAPGRSELAAGPAGQLAELTRAVGTDCFLTAQVIGHIDASEVAQDDTLNAHRLARARADAVQASLIGGGLPAKAIASVWDWQFMVPAPRATLWVFELTAGEDCDGRPLRGDLVAQVPPTEQATAEPERAIARALAPAERPAGTAAEAARGDAAPRVVEPPAPQPVAQPGQARQGAPSFTQPVPAAEPQPVARAQPPEQPVARAQPPEQPVARAQPPEQRDTRTALAATPERAAKPPASDAKVERSPEGDLIITFATNSSYFPSGAAPARAACGHRCRRSLRGDPAGRRQRHDQGGRRQVRSGSGALQQVAGRAAARTGAGLAAQERRRAGTVDQAGVCGRRRLASVDRARGAGGLISAREAEQVAADRSRRATVRMAPLGQYPPSSRSAICAIEQ